MEDGVIRETESGKTIKKENRVRRRTISRGPERDKEEMEWKAIDGSEGTTRVGWRTEISDRCTTTDSLNKEIGSEERI